MAVDYFLLIVGLFHALFFYSTYTLHVHGLKSLFLFHAFILLFHDLVCTWEGLHDGDIHVLMVLGQGHNSWVMMHWHGHVHG